VPLFPPGPPVTIVVDGRPLAAYARAYLYAGRVLAPARPLLTQVADRLWFEGDVLVVERGARRVRVRVDPELRGQMDALYVTVGPVLRGIGAEVRYDPVARRMTVRSPGQSLASPTPFNPALPSPPPQDVFTPEPIATPRPVWNGSPLPRRTALPLSQPPNG
jgi:hypothetical protein